MCIFTSPYVDVADTRLFARLNGTRQVLVYEMSYAATGDLAMVLPLPVASRDEVSALRFIDLSACTDFFERLTHLIALMQVRRSRPGLLSSKSEPVRPPLRVHEVGAFDASFVPSADDFDRLDPRFRLPSGVRDALPQYADYGFAVFKLRDTAGAVKGAHPMAFEFETRMPQALFLPTVHVHDGSVHAAARFDHIAYLQGPCVLGEARYFSEAGELDEVAVASKREDLWRRRVDGWKFDREAGGLGVIWPAGPSESLRDSRDDQELAKVLRLVDEGKLAVETLPKSWRWIRMPLLDPRQDLYALGMSGMLPNADTFIPLAR